MKRLLLAVFIIIFAFSASGCAAKFNKAKDEEAVKVEKLSSQVEELNNAKKMLEDRLSKEIADKQILLEMANKGLIIAMANDILFDSGKAKLKPEALDILQRVASVMREAVPDRDIGVEGHTDNIPIKYSSWKSNWELSTARSVSVVHYLIEECGIEPGKLAAIGYGEFRPVASNDTKEGQSRNRRVEIVILPKDVSKKSYEEIQAKVSNEAKAEEAKVSEGAVSSNPDSDVK